MMKFIKLILGSLLIVASLFASGIVVADEPLPVPIGRVVWIKGTLKAVMENKEERMLQTSSVIYLHDTLVTDKDSHAEIVFTDQTLMTFKPNTKMYISDYLYKPKAQGSDAGKFVMQIVEGGFRTITGYIAKKNPNAYSIETPVATIGVRGTEYEVAFRNNQAAIGVYKGKPCITSKGKGNNVCVPNGKDMYAEADEGQPAKSVAKRPDILGSEDSLTSASMGSFGSGSGGGGGGGNSFCIS